MRTLTFNRIIGVGAMGTVYHAELRVPRGFSRQCAVKVMNSTSPDQEHFRARMRDEARLLGMLQDEQILGVSELVRVQGRDCVVMEYVEGVDLADLVREHTMPSRCLAELGAEVAGTMHRAHNAVHPSTGEPLRVIHRDVKPANVMITSRGGVRLLDFGVARAAFSARESQTQGLVLGTLNYFPPEILAGAEPTPAVDIYGLGLTLWECATGKDWGSPQVHKHRFERRVEQRLAEVGEDYKPLVPVLRKLLQWSPEDRSPGNVVEKLLLTAAEQCSGAGLRTWAREVVPPILERRSTSTSRDELVGKTLPIDSAGTQPAPVPLERLDGELLKRTASRMETETFNDLAPPAAVRRPERGATMTQRPPAPPPPRASNRDEVSPEVDTAPLPELEVDTTGGHPAPGPVQATNATRSGGHVPLPRAGASQSSSIFNGRNLLLLLAAAAVGGIVGLGVLLLFLALLLLLTI